jgi:hypothetical protein
LKKLRRIVLFEATKLLSGWKLLLRKVLLLWAALLGYVCAHRQITSGLLVI